MGFSQLFTGVITILGTLIFMLTVNVGITFVVVLLTPLSLFVANFIARRTFSMFKKQSEARAEQTALVDEMVGNEKVVQAFTHEAAAQEAFDEINERLRASSLKAIFYSSITNPSTRFINSVVYAGVGLTGALAAVSGAMTVGGLSAFLSYANQYTKPFNEISGVITELQNALVCAARLFELIEEPSQIPDAENARVLTAPEGRITAENVAFSYVADRPLIQRLNLDVQPGQRVAIVGPTGCGKTTLINLLMRFYDVDKGSISVEGTDIRSITRASLRRNYGMVLQDTWLKEGTVRENIVMGKPDATDEEVVAAAKASHAHGFITRLPDGYDTVLSGDGGSLSQGQKQLLCITRVMLCLPPMLTGRGDLLHRHAHRAAHSGGLRPPDAGPHQFHCGAPPFHHQKCRHHPGDEGRRHHRAGQSRAAARGGRLLRQPLQQPVCRLSQENAKRRSASFFGSGAPFFYAFISWSRGRTAPRCRDRSARR